MWIQYINHSFNVSYLDYFEIFTTMNNALLNIFVINLCPHLWEFSLGDIHKFEIIWLMVINIFKILHTLFC